MHMDRGTRVPRARIGGHVATQSQTHKHPSTPRTRGYAQNARAAARPVVFYFSTSWCRPCKTVAPAYEGLW